MELKLYGRLSYIDKYNKLHFTYLEDSDTYSKLAKHCGSDIEKYTMPHTRAGYHITVKNTNIFQQYLGLDCIIWVKLHNYKFISKLPKNYGEEITGTKLVLTDIELFNSVIPSE